MREGFLHPLEVAFSSRRARQACSRSSAPIERRLWVLKHVSNWPSPEKNQEKFREKPRCKGTPRDELFPPNLGGICPWKRSLDVGGAVRCSPYVFLSSVREGWWDIGGAGLPLQSNLQAPFPFAGLDAASSPLGSWALRPSSACGCSAFSLRFKNKGAKLISGSFHCFQGFSSRRKARHRDNLIL